jgi:methylated-DNA-protein-cysteine methyltransferase-like protein
VTAENARGKHTPFSEEVAAVIRSIPPGKVATYGQVAALAGNRFAARQVVRVLHAMSEREKLPWHRIVNAGGRISLPPGRGYELQKKLLEQEGVVFDETDRINLDVYLWK